MTPQISRNAQVLKFFAQADRGIPRKRLTKMAYMADVVALECLGHAISELPWRSDKYGPYSSAIPETVSELVGAGLAWTKETEESEDGPAWKRLFDAGKPTLFDFALDENEVLHYVVEKYLPMPTEELLFDVVYETAPFKARGQFREPLPMEVSANAGRRAVGFDLAKLIEAERQVDAGDYLTGQQFFDGLRNSISARYTK